MTYTPTYIPCSVALLALGSIRYINPLNAELIPIRHLLALVGAHHILHVSRVRVKSTDLCLSHFVVCIEALSYEYVRMLVDFQMVISGSLVLVHFIFRVPMFLTRTVRLEASGFIKRRHFVSNWVNISFSRNAVFHGFIYFVSQLPIPVAALSMTRVCVRSLAGIVCLNAAGGRDVCLLCVLCVDR